MSRSGTSASRTRAGRRSASRALIPAGVREWQRAEAWATWERMKAGDVREASKAEIDLEFEAARVRART